MKTIKKRPIPEAVSFEKIAEMKAELIKANTPPQLVALFSALYLTGARIEEILRLRARDIEVKIRHEIKTSQDSEYLHIELLTIGQTFDMRLGNRELYIPLNSGFSKEFAKDLLEWSKRATGPNDYLFNLSQDPTNEKRNLESETKAMYRFIHSLNFGAVRAKVCKNEEYVDDDLLDFHAGPHYLRFCRLVHLQELGFSPKALMYYAGWRTDCMLNIYKTIANGLEIGQEMLRISKLDEFETQNSVNKPKMED